MSYTALYRKFRPAEFEEVKGQEHIVRTLKNQVVAGRVGHAYIFSGTRGTGKTTIAKILAKAVNCEHPVDGSPCNECAMCQAISQQRSLNVMEIDAASNNGVANVREIIQNVQYSPTEGKYKVYIIDEAHMVTTEAFNALLKTLEEPPAYVIFILATTEIHKIPITILSRCQRYDFRRISIDTISERLKELMQKEGIEAQERAVRYIAKMADGSMRDALSLLDQCAAFYFGETLTFDKVVETLGTVEVESLDQMYRATVQRDITGLLKLLEQIILSGRDLGQMVADDIWFYRNLLLVKTMERPEEMVDVSTENMELLKEDADMQTKEELLRAIDILSELSNQIKYTSQKRVLVEIALIKLCTPQMNTDAAALLARLRAIESQLAAGYQKYLSAAEPQAAAPGMLQGGGSETQKEAAQPSEPVEYEEAVSQEVARMCQEWKGKRESMFSKSEFPWAEMCELVPDQAGGNHAVLVVPDAVLIEYLKQDLDTLICPRLEKEYGKKLQLRIAGQEADSKEQELIRHFQSIQSKINFKIEVGQENPAP